MKSTSTFRLQIIQEYNSRIKALISYSCSSYMFARRISRGSVTGKVIFEWCKQVADNWYAPRSAQEPLPRQSAHVGHVRVVDWEAKDPERETSQNQNNQQISPAGRERNRGRQRKIILSILIAETVVVV